MSPAIDFSAIPDLEPIPAGDYAATITKAEVKMSKKGSPKIDIRWAVEYEGQQRLVFDQISFHPNALWRTKLVLKALGFGADFSGDVETEDLIDREALISVDLETNRVDEQTGEVYPDRNTVVKVSPLAAGALTGTW